MIINAPTIALTLVVISFFLYGGLVFIRKFALQIAQQNHDAILAMDQADEEKRQKRERAADAAAASAYANVEPLITQSKSTDTANSTATPQV
ncbi:expressed unknown protein [Seminavis robusta]|uniref:Uncharacterized protein n=1 Tax=Seminavis robusta TaxID=568900 RepID=A0A9N8HYM1_9STRA|nr:expressed unknown protein [Seminavis robusta]|eukprot:Sro2946_g340790.1 n/a (92) ;mRNA; f:8902-9177